MEHERQVVFFRIDLVFVHRRLRCLVIIDLKVGTFGYLQDFYTTDHTFILIGMPRRAR